MTGPELGVITPRETGITGEAMTAGINSNHTIEPGSRIAPALPGMEAKAALRVA